MDLGEEKNGSNTGFSGTTEKSSGNSGDDHLTCLSNQLEYFSVPLGSHWVWHFASGPTPDRMRLLLRLLPRSQQ